MFSLIRLCFPILSAACASFSYFSLVLTSVPSSSLLCPFQIFLFHHLVFVALHCHAFLRAHRFLLLCAGPLSLLFVASQLSITLITSSTLASMSFGHHTTFAQHTNVWSTCLYSATESATAHQFSSTTETCFPLLGSLSVPVVPSRITLSDPATQLPLRRHLLQGGVSTADEEMPERQFGMWSATTSPCVFWPTRVPRREHYTVDRKINQDSHMAFDPCTSVLITQTLPCEASRKGTEDGERRPSCWEELSRISAAGAILKARL